MRFCSHVVQHIRFLSVHMSLQAMGVGSRALRGAVVAPTLVLSCAADVYGSRKLRRFRLLGGVAGNALARRAISLESALRGRSETDCPVRWHVASNVLCAVGVEAEPGCEGCCDGTEGSSKRESCSN